MAESVHTARWIDQLHDEGWDLHLFPVHRLPLSPDLREVTVYPLVRHRAVPPERRIRQRGVPWPLPRGGTRLTGTLERMTPLRRPARLARLIASLEPAVVHSLEMQHAGYLTLESRHLLGERRFPPWIYSCWGSDIAYFGSDPAHEPRIRAVLQACDYLITDCTRDARLAGDFGFAGEQLGIFPGPGGFDLERMRGLRRPAPVSERRLIILKGAHDVSWVGRGLVALEALQRLAPELAGYEVVIHSADSIVAEYVSRITGLELRILPHSPHEVLVELLGRARLAISVNVSDGTSNSMLEAMVMGALPIQSDTGSAREWIRDGENGLLVPPEDVNAIEAAIRRAVTEDTLVERAAELNERLTSERISRRVVTPRVIDLYERVATGR
jgi:glycosyltransferase involved in cell wall biosynthesis